VSTARATGDSESLARSLQRSRELVVEPSELQRLPATAMIVSYGSDTGGGHGPGLSGGPGASRRVLLVDANPAIGTLPTATLGALDAAPGGAAPGGVGRGFGGVDTMSGGAGHDVGWRGARPGPPWDTRPCQQS
jgi:hypothetical protein